MSGKTFVVERSNSAQRIPIQAKSLQELIKLGCTEHQIPPQNANAFFEDGTEIDEETFDTLNPFSIVILLAQGEKQQFLNSRAKAVMKQFVTLFCEKKRIMCEKVDELSICTLSRELLAQCEAMGGGDVIPVDSREQDPTWFEGLPAKDSSKDKVMCRNAQNRIKSYFYKTKDEISKANLPLADAVMEDLRGLLLNARYEGALFERGNLCTKSGIFHCQGVFDQDSCSFYHQINPYFDCNSRKMFGMWNLDHQIERSRSIIPSLIEACKGARENQLVNSQYFYSLLFTKDNLRLVYFVCHCKKTHEGFTCQEDKYYLKKKRTKKQPVTRKVLKRWQ